MGARSSDATPYEAFGGWLYLHGSGSQPQVTPRLRRFCLPAPRCKPGGEVERRQGQQNERVGVRVGAKRQYRVQVEGRQLKQGQRRVGKGQGHQSLLDKEVQREPDGDEGDVGGKEDAGEGAEARRWQGVVAGHWPMVMVATDAGGGSDGANGVVVAQRRGVDAVVVAVLVFDEELLRAVAVGFQRADMGDFVP